MVWQTERRITNEILGMKGLGSWELKKKTTTTTTTKEAQDFKTNSPCQHLRKCLKNMHSDVRVWGVNGTCIVYILTFCILFL